MDVDDSQTGESFALSVDSAASTPAATGPRLEDLDRAPTTTSNPLAIAEIMNAILDHVRAQPSGYKATLASLARACKLFQEPALDALYHDLDSVNDLLRCMTSDVCAINDNLIVFRRPMWSRDRDTLQLYGARVKTLTVHANEPQLNSESILAVCMIRMVPDPRTLCPNLRSLLWATTAEHYQPLLPCLIPPGLSHLSLPHMCASRFWSHDIPSLCPSLRTFTVTGHSRKPADLGFLRQWPHLTTLKCHHVVLSKQTVIDCALLLDLHELSLVVTSGNGSSKPQYASLSKLDICSLNDINPINTFLSRFKAENVVTLDVLTSADSTEQDFVSFFDIMGKPGPKRRLQSLTVRRVCLTGFGQRRSVHLDMSIFRSLLQSHDLVSLSIDVVSFDMKDRDLEELASALPKLEYLQLLTCPINGKPLNTLQGLIPLLKHCPKLSDLTISLDASSIPDNMDYPRVRHVSLGHLTCIDSPINNAGQVAVFLSDIVPRVTLVSDNSVDKDKWQEVARSLKYCVMAREHERKICKGEAA